MLVCSDFEFKDNIDAVDEQIAVRASQLWKAPCTDCKVKSIVADLVIYA